jgi:hypothetical protein
MLAVHKRLAAFSTNTVHQRKTFFPNVTRQEHFENGFAPSGFASLGLRRAIRKECQAALLNFAGSRKRMLVFLHLFLRKTANNLR